MKKLRMLSAMLLFGAMVMLMGAVVQAKPSIPAKTKVYGGYYYDDARKAFVTSTRVDITIKGMKQDAAVTKISCSNKSVRTPMAFYDTTLKEWYISIASPETTKKISTNDFTVRCTVKQDGKTYHLKTTCHYVDTRPFKKLSVCGQNVLTKVEPKLYFAKMKLAGKKLKISAKTKKGFNYDGCMLLRNGKEVKVKKSTKLKKGDHLLISAYKSDWKEYALYTIWVR